MRSSECDVVIKLEESEARDLYPLLSEFHRIQGHPLRAVRHIYDEGCLDEIALESDRDCLIVKAEPDYDTMTFHVVHKEDFKSAGSIDVSHSETWRRFIGESFGWGWVAINQQGYLDGILLSFGGITPNVLLIVMASTIKETIIQEVS